MLQEVDRDIPGSDVETPTGQLIQIIKIVFCKKYSWSTDFEREPWSVHGLHGLLDYLDFYFWSALQRELTSGCEIAMQRVTF